MRRYLIVAGFCILAAGCEGNGNGQPKDGRDAPGVFEVVLKAELKEAKKGEGHYLFVDGKDPAPEMMKRFNKLWPDLQAGSKVPKEGKAMRISIGELEWIDSNTAEVRGGFSNGMDGRGSKYRVIRSKDGWTIDKVTVEFLS